MKKHYRGMYSQKRNFNNRVPHFFAILETKFLCFHFPANHTHPGNTNPLGHDCNNTTLCFQLNSCFLKSLSISANRRTSAKFPVSATIDFPHGEKKQRAEKIFLHHSLPLFKPARIPCPCSIRRKLNY